MNMNILQIKCFLEVLATNNFCEAADHLYLTQSTVSKKIASLEKELDILLFERRGRKVYVTPAGRELAKDFNQLVQVYSKLESKAEELKRAEKSSEYEVRIALLPFVEKLGIIPALRRYSQENHDFVPHIEIVHEKQMLFDQQIDCYDMLFCSDLFLDTKMYNIAHHSQREFFAITSEDNKLAQKKEIYIKDLADENMILLPADTMLLEYQMDAFKRHSISPEISVLTDRTEIANEFIKSIGSVCCTIRANYPTMMEPGITWRRIVDSPKFNYVFAWKKKSKLSPAIKKCAEFLIKETKDYGKI